MYDKEVVMPIKRFDENTMLLPDNSSVIAAIMQRCKHLIIEDAELSLPLLQNHFDKNGLGYLDIMNANKNTRGGGSHLLLVNHRN